MISLGDAIGYLTLDTSGLSDGLSSAVRDLREFRQNAEDSGSRVTALSSTFGKVGSTLTTTLTLPLVGAGAAFVNYASDMENALTKIQTQTGSTTEEMEAYEQSLKNIYSGGYGESFEDVADAISEVSKQMDSLDSEGIESATQDALVLRDAFEYDVSESVRAADTLMTNFGVTSEEAFNLIATGAQNGLDYSGELLDSINEYSVQFKKVGMDADDMFNLFQIGMESGSFNLDKLGDAVKEFSIRVIDASDTTNEGLQMIGLDVDETVSKFEQGGDAAREAFMQVIDGLEAMESPFEQSIAGVDLFGTMWEDLGPEVVLSFNDITDAAYATSDAIGAMDTAQTETLSGAVTRLKNNFQILAAELGESIAPIVGRIADAFASLAQKFSGLSDGTQRFIVIIGSIAAAVGPVLIIVGKVITAVQTLIPVIQTIVTVITKINPIIAIITTAVGLLFAAWNTNFMGIQEKTQQVFTFLQGLFQSFISIIQTVWTTFVNALQTIWSGIWDSIVLIFNTIKDNILLVLDTFIAIFTGDWSTAWENIKLIFQNTWNMIKGVAENIWNIIKSLFGDFLNSLVSALKSIGSSLLSAAESAFNAIKEGFQTVWEAITGWFSKAVEDPVGAVEDLGSALFNAGKAAFNKLWDGFKAVWNKITGWVEDIFGWISDKFSAIRDKAAGIREESNNARSADTNGSYAVGLSYVPYNGFVAKLHEGERILTKQEAQDYNSRRISSGGDTYNFYSQAKLTPAEAAREMKKAKRELMLGFY